MQKAISTLCSLIAASGLTLTLTSPTLAAERRSSMEKSLLGIRVLDSYKKVLAKFGQPTRVYRMGETVLTVPAIDASGNPTGGIKGLDDGSGGANPLGGGGRGFPGMPGGMPGGGRRGGFPGMPGGQGGMPGMGQGGYPGMPGMGQGGYPGMGQGGFPGGPGGMPGGFPGGQGGMPGMGQGGYPGMPGMGQGGYPGMGQGGFPGGQGGQRGGGLGAGTQQQSNTFADAGGFMWVYLYPKQELLYWFVFNRDSRIVAIIEMGRIQGKPTSLGIKLGDPVKHLYSIYGWPDTTEMQNDSLALHYNIRQHVQFNILNNKVVSIAVFLTEDQKAILNNYASGNGNSGAGRGMGGRGGFPGGGGFPGRGGFGGGGKGGGLSD